MTLPEAKRLLGQAKSIRIWERVVDTPTGTRLRPQFLLQLTGVGAGELAVLPPDSPVFSEYAPMWAIICAGENGDPTGSSPVMEALWLVLQDALGSVGGATDEA